jgi:hypothetical protein
MKKLMIIIAIAIGLSTPLIAKNFTYEEFVKFATIEKEQAENCLAYLQTHSKQEIMEQGPEKFQAICMATFENQWMEDFFFDPANRPVAIMCNNTPACTRIVADYQMTVMKMAEHLKGGR